MESMKEIAEELHAFEPPRDENGILWELKIIALKLLFIAVYAFTFFYGITYLFIFRNYSWELHNVLVMRYSFIVFAISVILVGLRARAGSAVYIASALRTAWTQKKMEEGAFRFYRNFALGIKKDTIAFYGSFIVLAFSTIVLGV